MWFLCLAHQGADVCHTGDGGWPRAPGGHAKEGDGMTEAGLSPQELCVTNVWKETQRRDMVPSGALQRGGAHFMYVHMYF